MYRLRLAALTGASVAMVLLALVAAGTAGGNSPRANYCDVEALWGGFFMGTVSGTGFVAFDIFNQAPPAPEDDDGGEDFALATQLALGLGNAGEGDKYHFLFETVIVTTGATARGHGFLFVPTETGTATFVIAGHGEHMLAGKFALTGGGDVECFDADALGALAEVTVDFQDPAIPDDEVTTGLAKCPDQATPEECEGDLG